MSFSVGIVGLPNAGKSTLFKSLTKKKVDIAPYPFTTISPNVGKVIVPDQRLKEIAEVIKPQKVTPASIEFIDIAGLVKKAHQGEGLGNQFLAQIRECRLILEIVRDFKADQVEHVEKEINSERDIGIIKMELILKDLETTGNALEKLEKKAESEDKETIQKINILTKIKEGLSQEKKILEIGLEPEENLLIKEFQLLTTKPVIYLLNIDKESDFSTKPFKINLKLEEEALELSESEIKELGLKSNLDYLIKACYNILDLITFYTVTGGKETRAWPTKRGSSILEAAAKVHSDFEEKFIKAEVVPWEKLIEARSWTKAKEFGWLKTVGKDHEVKDGDIIEFKI